MRNNPCSLLCALPFQSKFSILQMDMNFVHMTHNNSNSGFQSTFTSLVTSVAFAIRCCKEAGSGRGRKKPQFDFATYFTNVEKGKRTATGGYQASWLLTWFLLQMRHDEMSHEPCGHTVYLQIFVMVSFK